TVRGGQNFRVHSLHVRFGRSMLSGKRQVIVRLGEIPVLYGGCCRCQGGAQISLYQLWVWIEGHCMWSVSQIQNQRHRKKEKASHDTKPDERTWDRPAHGSSDADVTQAARSNDGRTGER